MSGIEIKEYSLYLFDLDSTLTETISGKTFPNSVNDRRFIEGRWEKLLDLHEQGKKTAIVTNQGGAAWGFLDQEAMNAFLKSLCKSAEIDKYFVCYRDTGEKARASDRTDKALTVPEYYKEWDRRKPGPGMLIEAMDHFGIDRQDTLMVGDRSEDAKAAEAASCDFQWEWQYFDSDKPIIV
jgi:D-glycero-D-manno-heptose 1,7-bisphosphate phosphatase